MSEQRHTPGPWKIMADPINKELHPLHENRYIVTGDAVLREWQNSTGAHWELGAGSIVCKLRDQQAQKADARLIAAAPALLEACRCALADMEGTKELLDGQVSDAYNLTLRELEAAIAAAETK
jgi:hypothetical protein